MTEYYERIYREIAKKEREKIMAKLWEKIWQTKQAMISLHHDTRFQSGKIAFGKELLAELEAEDDE